MLFQHTAARRRLGGSTKAVGRSGGFQHTAARRRLVDGIHNIPFGRTVSTHSRPKAAGRPPLSGRMGCQGFNTQPPEGGWGLINDSFVISQSFNTQPPEGGWSSPISGL